MCGVQGTVKSEHTMHFPLSALAFFGVVQFLSPGIALENVPELLHTMVIQRTEPSRDCYSEVWFQIRGKPSRRAPGRERLNLCCTVVARPRDVAKRHGHRVVTGF